MAHSDPSRSNRRSARAAAARAGRMRLVSLALALAVLAGGPGCMVMDELDSAAAKMPDAKKKPEKKRDPSGESLGAAGRLAAARSATLERSKQWWGQAKTMTPGEQPAGIVSCRLPEGMQFMKVEDCLAQGGTPAKGAS